MIYRRKSLTSSLGSRRHARQGSARPVGRGEARPTNHHRSEPSPENGHTCCRHGAIAEERPQLRPRYTRHPDETGVNTW